jgi:soluble lytic murein transglycosylase-like protein
MVRPPVWACLAVITPVMAGELSPLPPLEKWTAKYDVHFRKHSKHYFGPNFDWRWFKAQAIVESGLKPVARGRRGSRGIMQIKRSTFQTLKEKEPRFLDIDDPHWNIAAAVYYDRVLFDQWGDRKPLLNRLSFTFASYNAGPSHVRYSAERARRKERTDGQWKEVAPFVPKTTRRYVRRIVGLMGEAPPQKGRTVARTHGSVGPRP